MPAMSVLSMPSTSVLMETSSQTHPHSGLSHGRAGLEVPRLSHVFHTSAPTDYLVANILVCRATGAYKGYGDCEAGDKRLAGIAVQDSVTAYLSGIPIPVVHWLTAVTTPSMREPEEVVIRESVWAKSGR
ncbi:hypothetical protein C8T65DRAFT_693152 [Cerioporus squamosus]|nr:hypothetical protein C8T65DRAFT_693152 [Cerioporus squamosus]